MQVGPTTRGLALASAPTRRQTAALSALLLATVAAVPLLSAAVEPSTARAFDLVAGSVYLEDDRAPVAVDLADGRPTARLVDANAQVGATSMQDVRVVPLAAGSLLLDAATGQFNLLDAAGLVVKAAGGGVRLPGDPAPAAGEGATRTTALPAGDGAYLVQTGPARTSVYLVGRQTVESARTPGAQVVPRASARIEAASPLAPGAQAVVGTDLWLLTNDTVGTDDTGDTVDRRTVRRLVLPDNSRPGVGLDEVVEGTVTGPAAFGVATPASGPAVLALASRDVVRVRTGTSDRDLPLTGLDDADRVLAATNQDDRLAFLYHRPAGWALVTVDLAADAPRLRGPVALPGLPPTASLAAPAQAGGALWTMQTGRDGGLWTIDDDDAAPVPGAADYPVVRGAGGQAVEAGGFGDGAVVARGSRVLFNSRSHLRAVAVFADGTRAPRILDKGAAVDLTATGGAATVLGALAPDGDDDPAPPGAPPSSAPTTPPAPVRPEQAVDALARCRSTVQVPNVPAVVAARPGSRSLRLEWTYPLLDSQDCVPSTYTVSVVAVSPGAPEPPGRVTVQGQTGVELTGLFPSTTYSVTVTAFLRGRGTSSSPVTVTTGPEGPAAPREVAVSADGAGGWVVRWTTCGGVGDGCVPALSWTLVPSFCDGRGLSRPPEAITVAGDPTQSTFTTTYSGGSALLGRGLRFSVAGSGVDGEAGEPASGRCVASWAPPRPSALRLSASAPPPADDPDATTSTTVTLDLGGDPVAAVGGVGATFSYALLRGGDVVARSGPTSDLSVTFDDLQAGRAYAAQVVVSPPGHPEAAVTVGPVDVVAAQARWPLVSGRVGYRDVDDLTGRLTLTLTGISTASSRGQTYDLAGELVCGSARMPLSRSGIDPADSMEFTVERRTFNGSCEASVRLAQNRRTALDPPLFGPEPRSSRVDAGTVTVSAPAFFGVSAGDFEAVWGGPVRGRSAVELRYTGDNPLVPALTADWQVAVSDDSGATFDCGSAGDPPPLAVRVDQACVDAKGAAPRVWRVSVSFEYFGQRRGPFVVETVEGTPPTYAPPCELVPTDLVPTWGGTAADPAVLVSYVRTASRLAGCSGWRLSLKAPGGQACGGADGVPDADTPVRIDPRCATAASPQGWTVVATYDDREGVRRSSGPLPVNGTPPT